MIDNSKLLENLMTQGSIRLCYGAILQNIPPSLPLDFDFAKIEGMLLGIAVGDSLGATSEGQLPDERQKTFGEITDYVAGRRSNYKTVGVPTDDTQLTFWTLKQLIQDNGLVPNNLAKRFCKHHIVGIGNTVKSFIRNYKDNNISWYKSGEDSLGNGALMRISPVIVPYLKNPHPSMYADAALATMMTHNSYANTSSCIAFIHILWSLLSMKTSPDSHWWTDTFCSIAETLEGDKLQVSNRAKQDNFKVPLWQFTDKVVNDAIRRNLSVLEACNQWNSGANLYETIPSVLYILARHAQDGDQAIIRAVNDTKDNDSVAAIVGSAIGALYGLNGLPIKWIEDLTGRTRSGDDGAVFKLIFMAKRAFWF